MFTDTQVYIPEDEELNSVDGLSNLDKNKTVQTPIKISFFDQSQLLKEIESHGPDLNCENVSFNNT